MQVSVNRRIKMPIYVQLKEQIKSLIVTGELTAGTRLPPADRLADNLGINRHTVLRAYSELAQQGFVELRNGVGTFVADALPKAETPAMPHDVLAQMDAIIITALQRGMTPEQVGYMVLARAKLLATQTPQNAPAISAAIFECNAERLFYYAGELKESLGITIRPYLISSLDEMTALPNLADVDFVVTSFFHLAEVRRKIRRIPAWKHLEIYAVAVRPHLDVLRKLGELPPGSRLGILYFEGPYYTEERLQAMVEHIQRANLKNIQHIEPIYVRDRLPVEELHRFNALLVRPENLADTQKQVDLDIPLIEYHNVLDRASVAMLREVVRGLREDKVVMSPLGATGPIARTPTKDGDHGPHR